MRKKWKYDKLIALLSVMRLLPVSIGIACVFLILSCNSRDEHRHIPTNKTSELDGLAQPTNQVVFSEVKTISSTHQSITPIANATGVISYDPRFLNNISARFSGRIEKLYVRFNFENISKGQRIMDIYSPEVLTAEENLIFLLRNSSNDIGLINSSKQKLQLLGVTSEQLNLIESSKKLINPLPVYSPYSGHIHDIGISSGAPSSMNNGMSSGMGSSTTSSTSVQIENLPSSQTSVLSIKEGMYVERGQQIFSVYNTAQVWAVLNIFPQDAAQIKTGDKVSISAETYPTNIISSTISYIEPKARVYLQNPDSLHLKIGTLVTAKITSTAIKGIWLPHHAVVNLGQKQIVFIKTKKYFITKTIQTGVVIDSLVQVISGLKGDEVIAVNAQYMVDSESFIQTEENVQK
jgi:Cu(I)/Ag(I) efflux system membrane fusion protein